MGFWVIANIRSFGGIIQSLEYFTYLLTFLFFVMATQDYFLNFKAALFPKAAEYSSPNPDCASTSKSPSKSRSAVTWH